MYTFSGLLSIDVAEDSDTDVAAAMSADLAEIKDAGDYDLAFWDCTHAVTFVSNTSNGTAPLPNTTSWN